MTATSTSPDVLALLDQTDVWVTKDGRTIALPDLEDSHRSNLVAWLERNAGRLSRIAEGRAWIASTSVEMHHGGDVPDGVFSAMSSWESDAQWAVTDPLGWLRSKPLYRALTDLFYRTPVGSRWRTKSRLGGWPHAPSVVVRTGQYRDGRPKLWLRREAQLTAWDCTPERLLQTRERVS